MVYNAHLKGTKHKRMWNKPRPKQLPVNKANLHQDKWLANNGGKKSPDESIQSPRFVKEAN
jgi:hypothetical protein